MKRIPVPTSVINVMKVRAARQTDALWELLLDLRPGYRKSEGVPRFGGGICCNRKKNEILGVIVIELIGKDIVEVKNLAVNKLYRRRGVASHLLTSIKNKVKQETPDCMIYVKTANTSYPALALYERRGFVLSDIVENYFLTHYEEPIFENGRQATDQYILIYQS